MYYDCATEGKPAILKFRRSGSQEVVRNVKLKKGKGNEVDINLVESVSKFCYFTNMSFIPDLMTSALPKPVPKYEIP